MAGLSLGGLVRFCQLYEVLRSQPPSTHLGHLLMLDKFSALGLAKVWGALDGRVASQTEVSCMRDHI